MIATLLQDLRYLLWHPSPDLRLALWLALSIVSLLLALALSYDISS